MRNHFSITNLQLLLLSFLYMELVVLPFVAKVMEIVKPGTTEITNMTLEASAFTEQFESIEVAGSKDEAAVYPITSFFPEAVINLKDSFELLSKLLIVFTSFIYPAYLSFKSMYIHFGDDKEQWLTYWICFSALSIAETVLPLATDLSPMNFWNIAIIVWMWHPSTRGAKKISDHMLRPLLLPYMCEADAPAKKEEDLKPYMGVAGAPVKKKEYAKIRHY